MTQTKQKPVIQFHPIRNWQWKQGTWQKTIIQSETRGGTRHMAASNHSIRSWKWAHGSRRHVTPKHPAHGTGFNRKYLYRNTSPVSHNRYFNWCVNLCVATTVKGRYYNNNNNYYYRGKNNCLYCLLWTHIL